MPLFISFHTPDYALPAKHLEESCKEQGVRLHSKRLDPAGTWRENCAMKGQFVLDCLLEFKCPVVWVDADAQLKAKPRLFQKIGCDFAAFWPEGRRTLLSGTLFFNFSDKAIHLATEWAKACQQKGEKVWDQKLLTKVFEGVKAKKSPIFCHLPQGYCKIWDARWLKGETKEEVVVHYQYSRDVKDRRRGSGYRNQ
jgi:hypothetical protein